MVYEFLADGFEIVEAMFPVDVMRRAGIEVKTVGIAGTRVTSSAGVTVEADLDGRAFVLPEDAELVVLPGGMPGTTNLLACDAVKKAESELEKVKIEDEVTDVVCEQCGRHMVIKYGPHGKFLACPGFPECRNTKPYLEKIGVPCPKCGKDIVLRRSSKGRKFYSCEGYPECDFISWKKPEIPKTAEMTENSKN